MNMNPSHQVTKSVAEKPPTVDQLKIPGAPTTRLSVVCSPIKLDSEAANHHECRAVLEKTILSD